MKTSTPPFASTLLLVMLPLAYSAEPILIADFESAVHSPWTITGTAFGPGPATGPVHGQMEIRGFNGKGFLNSYHGGDGSKGTLTSVPFKIERKFITFLIGGGGFANETCMNLMVDGKVVHTATGTNTEPGGSETLQPFAWDVAEFIGKNAVIEVVDAREGGWGHVNVDHLMQTDDKGSTPKATPPPPPTVPVQHTLTIDADYLQLPVMGRTGHSRKGLERFEMVLDGKVERILHLDLAAKDEQPEQTYSYDVREFRGKQVTLNYRSNEADVLKRLALSNTENCDPNAYATEHRPQFHFSPRVGWMNDINGTYYHDGLYHLFYQFNPTNRSGGAGFDMHWGHSVSKDLLHWEEWPVAIFPNHTGQCYSGTTVVTQAAIPGLTTKPGPVMFFAATTPFAQHIATTADGGKSWQRYAGNPVVPNMGDGDRDPKVVWHEASKHYCMVLYVGGPDTYRLLRSKDLKTWEQTQSLPHWFECPEFFPVKSTITGENLWLLYGCYRTPKDHLKAFSSDSCYQLGRFDGKTFTPVDEIRHAHEGPNFYGALIFNNQPQGRNIMMGWTRGTPMPPGEAFNQYSSVPLELSLKKVNKTDTLCYEPIRELEAQRSELVLSLAEASISEAAAKLTNLQRTDLLDVELTLPANETVTVTIREQKFTYDAKSRTVNHAQRTSPVHPDGSLSVRLLIDRGVVETFWNGGEIATCTGSNHTTGTAALKLEGTGKIASLKVFKMKSIWAAK